MTRFARCDRNAGYEIDLTVGRLYEIVEPEPNDPESMIRIIDNSGEDYLFERVRFTIVELPDFSHWDYRIVKLTLPDGTPFYAIYKVFYDEERVPKWCSVVPDFPHAATLEELQTAMESYRRALDRPVLKYEDFDRA